MHVYLSRFVKFFVFIFLLFALLIALLPSLLSTDWGRKQTVAWINRSISGNIEIRHLVLHWGKGQLIEGFLLKDPEGQAVLEFDKFSTDATLWQLITKKTCLGFTLIEDLNAAIITDQKGETNLQRALGIQASKKTPPLNSSTIVLSDVNVSSYFFAPNHPLSAQIKGLTRQDNLNGSFDITFSLNGLKASDWNHLKNDAQNYLNTEEGKDAQLQAKIVNFPVDLIDRIAALQTPHLNGLFRSLIGDRINLNVDKEPEKLAFHLTIMAPLLQGDLKGIFQKNALLLKEPAAFHLNLTPKLINPFIQTYFELLEPSRIEILFSKLIIPFDFFTKNRESDLCLFGFNSELKVPETRIDVNSIGDIKILNLQAHLNSQKCDDFVQVEVIGQAQQGKKPFDLHFTSIINKPRNAFNLLHQIGESGSSKLTFSKLPLQIIPFFYKHPEWSDNLGSSLDGQLEIQSKNKNGWIGTFSFQTPALALKKAQLSLGNEVTLLSPAEFHWTVPFDCLGTLLTQKELALEQPCSLNFVVKRFQMPLEEPHLASFELNSSIPHIRLPKLFNWGAIQFDDFLLQIKGQNLSEIHSNITGKFSLLTPTHSPSPLIPVPLEIKQSSTWKMAKGGVMQMTTGQLQLTNSITQIHAEGTIDSQYNFELTQPAELRYTLSNAAFQSLSQLFHKEWPTLQEPTPIHLHIDPTEFNLRQFSLSNLYLQGVLEAKKLVIQDELGDFPVLENMMLTWVLDSPRNNIYTNLKGVTYTKKDKKPSPISAHMQFWLKPGEFKLAHTQSEIRMNFSGMPTSILNVLFDVPNLNPIIGPILDVNIKAFYDPAQEKNGYLDLVIDSTNFHTEGRFIFNEYAQLYEGIKQPIFRLTITPESYQQIKKIFDLKNENALSTSFTVTGVLSKFNIPIQKNWTEKGIFDFKFSTTKIQWQDRQLLPWKLEGFLSTQNLKDQVDFSTQLLATTPLKITGSFSNLFDDNSRLLNWHEMGIQFSMDGQGLQPSLIQSFLLLKPDENAQLKALFGDTFDIRAHARLLNLNGPLQASIKGIDGQIELDGQLKNGVLTLKRSLAGSVKMTPLFVQTFLAPYSPLLSSAVGAENPLTFTVDAAQFSYPIHPFQLNQVKIGKGNINLGKIKFRNEGELQSLLNVIRSVTDPFVTIWFTPIYFNLNQGILSLNRFDLLVAHAYPLANWGSVNLFTNQADFVLGVTGQTLNQVYGIQGLDDKYILQIPFHTSKGKLEIDKKKLTARISSLLAQTHGGEKGKLLGNILDMVLSEKGEPYPQPTTQPFPWESEFPPPIQSKPSSSGGKTSSQQSEDTTSSEKKKKKKKLLDDENLKDLQEGARQLLDQWFK